MNYTQLIKDLIHEATTNTRYHKMMSPAMRILTLIALTPVLIVEVALIIAYYFLLFVYHALVAPITYLETWLEGKKDTVKHATQAVMYFVCLPAIFALRFLAAMISFAFYFVWFALTVVTYIITLGSSRFQPFIDIAKFDKTYTWSYKPNEKATSAFSIVAFVLFDLLAVLLLVIFLSETPDPDLNKVMLVVGVIYAVTILIVNPIMFRKKEIAARSQSFTTNPDAIDTAVEAVEAFDSFDDTLPPL